MQILHKLSPIGLLALLSGCIVEAPRFEVDNRSKAGGIPAPADQTARDDNAAPVQEDPQDPITDDDDTAVTQKSFDGPASGSLQASLTIAAPAQAGAYSPRRLEAIWVSDMNDQHVITLSANPGQRPQHLRQWRKVNGGQLDGFSGATITNYDNQPMNLQWDFVDKNGNTVEQGKYKLWMEITESNTNDNSQSGDAGYVFHNVIFEVSSEPSMFNDNNNPSFKNISINHNP